MGTNYNEIKVSGYRGTWSVIDDIEVTDEMGTDHSYFLLQHDYYGDETCYLVIEDNPENWKGLNIYKGPVFETYDDIETCLEDEGIL